MALMKVTDATFEQEVIASDLPVLVDFYADWCGPCKTMTPILEELSTRYQGRAKIVKVDVERNPMLAQTFQIRSIPTMAVMQGQKVVDMRVGAQDRATMEALIEKFAGPAQAGGVETWDAERVQLALEAQMVTPVDVREQKDYQRARLPGALNLPADGFESRLSELNEPGMKYVFYARTDEGVKELADKAAASGVGSIVLEGGLLAWESEFFDVEKG